MDEKVSIILLNYNGKQFNKHCIDSLLVQSYTNFEIIFVNNRSDDGSCEEVENLYSSAITAKKITIVTPGYNAGFAGGNNIGVAASDPRSTYICLLNNDTHVPSDRLHHLVAGIHTDASLGAVGAMIYDQGYEEHIKEITFVHHKKGINNYFFDSVLVDQTEQDKTGPVIFTTGVSGCCLLYKKALLPQPFDEIYFAYLEDTALCLKIILQGHKIGLVKHAIVHHFGSGSFGKKPSRLKAFHAQKNYLLNFLLYSQGRRSVLVFPFFLGGVLIRTLITSPCIRCAGLLKAVRRIMTHLSLIRQTKRTIKVTISPKMFYQQLADTFISIPYYTGPQPVRILKTVSLLNSVSKLYFTGRRKTVGRDA